MKDPLRTLLNELHANKAEQPIRAIRRLIAGKVVLILTHAELTQLQNAAACSAWWAEGSLRTTERKALLSVAEKVGFVTGIPGEES